jgi:hypothetical protein
MKKLLGLIFILASFQSYAQISKMGGVASRVNDSSAYVTSTAVTTAHTEGYADLWYSNSSDLWWVWNGSAYVNWDPSASGSGSSFNHLTPNIQTGDYTATAADTIKLIYMRHASTGQTLTLPGAATIPVGRIVAVLRDSTNTITIAGAAGVDVIGSLTMTQEKEVAVFHHRETNKWVRLSGPGENIYNTDGTMTAARTIDMDGNNITWQNFDIYEVIFGNSINFGTNNLTMEMNTDQFHLEADGDLDLDATDDLKINGVSGTTGQVIGNVNGHAQWETPTGGGATAAGATGNVQYKSNGGGLQAEAAFSYDSATNILDVDTVTVIDDAYDETDWDGNTAVPTKNAVRDLSITLGNLAIGSITGTISLDSDDLGTLWEVSGTATNYTVDLPTAIGNDDKTIIFKGVAALTKNVTIAGISGQTIDGYSTWVIAGTGSLTLISDGANWSVVNSIGSWVDYTPVWDGFSADPTVGYAKYFRNGKMCTVSVRCSAGGTSDATNLTITLPFPAAYAHIMPAMGQNNGALLTSPARLDTGVGSSTATAYTTMAAAAWTAANGKQLNFTITYEIQ